MREVYFTDENGYRHRSFVRDSDGEDMAKYGIIADPPDVHNIDCEYLLREIHNALVDNRIFSWEDAQKSPTGLRVVDTLVRRTVSGLLRIKDGDGQDSKSGG